MKIYHTETQADYDALMNELEKQGCFWSFGLKLTQSGIYGSLPGNVGVRVDGTEVDRSDLNYYKQQYPNIPITKYKAKAEDKMKFNKQNIEQAFDRFLKYGDYSILEMKESILNLVDEPEKVVVPKFVADYLEERKRDEDGLVTSLYPFQDNFGELIEDWFEEEENIILFTKAWIDGYSIEPEQLYYIPLPDLETSDGLQQVLSKYKDVNCYFASRPNKHTKYCYTKEELEQVPEIYKPYAKPIEEENE